MWGIHSWYLGVILESNPPAWLAVGYAAMLACAIVCFAVSCWRRLRNSGGR